MIETEIGILVYQDEITGKRHRPIYRAGKFCGKCFAEALGISVFLSEPSECCWVPLVYGADILDNPALYADHCSKTKLKPVELQ